MTTGRLARATGQDDTLDPRAVALLLPWTEANAGLLAASGMFGSRIDVGPGAPNDLRLPGLLGRTTCPRHVTQPGGTPASRLNG